MAKDEVTIRDVYDLLAEFRKEMKQEYVTVSRFGPVEKIAYGLVTLILVAVVTAMVSGVIQPRAETLLFFAKNK